jgi:hypothetical protein
MPRTRRPPCPNCGAATHWIRCSLPEGSFVVHSYECPKCSFIHTAVEPDPLVQAQGWLKGELRPLEKRP